MLKVANRSFSVAGGSPARCVSEREKGGGFAAREPRTVGSGAPLVTFPATGKSPGCRAERLHSGSQELTALQNPPGGGGAKPLAKESSRRGRLSNLHKEKSEKSPAEEGRKKLAENAVSRRKIFI